MLGYLVPRAMFHPSQLRAQLPSSSFLVNCISIDYFAANIVWTYLINVSRVLMLVSIFLFSSFFPVSSKYLGWRAMNAGKVARRVFNLMCSCQTTPASGANPEEQMSAFQHTRKKTMHLFPKRPNNSRQVWAHVGRSEWLAKASQVGLICSWPRNQPQKEQTF